MAQTKEHPSLDILERNEQFEEVDGTFGFSRTLLIYQEGDKTYFASSKLRYGEASEVEPGELYDISPIPTSAYQPVFLPTFTAAPLELPPNTYVKKPRLCNYDGTDRIAATILQEVHVCEAIKQHPHPSLASYIGCQNTNNRISGLCFTLYDNTLMKLVNPRGFGKRQALLTRELEKDKRDYRQLLDQVEQGIRHLHSLGFIHNDLNPSNIMVSGDQAVIIDFGSCRPEGANIGDVPRTYEWYDETVQLSRASNDLDALEEIYTWLGIGSGKFKFPL